MIPFEAFSGYPRSTLSYLKATGLSLALLINFNVAVLMRGVKRVALNGPMTDG